MSVLSLIPTLHYSSITVCPPSVIPSLPIAHAYLSSSFLIHLPPPSSSAYPIPYSPCSLSPLCPCMTPLPAACFLSALYVLDLRYPKDTSSVIVDLYKKGTTKVGKQNVHMRVCTVCKYTSSYTHTCICTDQIHQAPVGGTDSRAESLTVGMHSGPLATSR